MNFEAWIPLLAVGIIFSTAVLVHLATHDVPFMPKWAWAMLVLVTMPLGGVLYLLIVVFGAGVREDAESRHT